MSVEIPVAAREHGILRLFALSMTQAEAEALRDPDTLARALGVDRVDPDHAEVVALSDIGALGLASYLSEGMGVRSDQLRTARTRIDALDGHVLLLRSAALDGQDLTLRPDGRLTLIETFAEDGAAPPPMTPLRSAGAAGGLAGDVPETPPPSNRRGWGPVLLLVLAALIALALVLGAA